MPLRNYSSVVVFDWSVYKTFSFCNIHSYSGFVPLATSSYLTYLHQSSYDKPLPSPSSEAVFNRYKRMKDGW